MIIDQLFTRPIFESQQGVTEAIQPGADTVVSVKKLWQYINRNLTDLASNASFYDERGNQPYIEDRLANLLKTSDGDAVTIAFDMGGNLQFDNNVLYVPVGNMWRYRGLILGPEFVKRVVGLLSKQTSSPELNEFARGEGGGDSGNYFKALASAWYNGTYDSGSLQKGIKTKEDIERLLDRGIVAPDGVTRKYNIDYNSDFDGVIIFSDDYYEHGDDDETDSRTGQPFGPYDYMEFSDDDLSESAMAEGRKKKKTSRSLGRYFFPGYGYYGSGESGEGGGDGGGGESANPGMAEAAQGHTIEAHGVRGMDRRTWHKTFRNTDQMIAWAEKHDAEIIGTRDLEQARHHNLSPARQDMAEGRRTGEYSRVLRALGLYYPDKFSMEELNTPDWHRVIAYKADVPVEYAGKVINDFTRPYDYNDEWPEDDEQDVTEGSDQQLSVRQLATISDEALDKAYGYGRSSPGNTFGWQANLKSAAYAKHMIDKGVTDIDEIADAIHKGWNVTAKAFVKNPDRFDDTEKLKAAGKLEAKLQQRAKLMNIDYSQLPDDEQEKDRVVARALLQAITGGGEQDITEGHKESYVIVRTDREGKKDVFAGNFDTYERAQKELDGLLAHPLHTKHKQKFEIKRKGQKDITEMDKSEPSAGRDTGPRSGPDREAKPITAKKATKDAADMLTRVVKDSHKKKDVKEGILGSDPNRGQKVPDWAKGGIIGKIGRKLDPAWSDVQITVPQHLLSKKSDVPATNTPAAKDTTKAASGTPTRAIPQRAGTYNPPPNFPGQIQQPGRTKVAPAHLPDSLPGEHDSQLPYRQGMSQKPQIQQIVPSMIKEKSINPLMKKLQAAMVKEGRVKELADDLKTMADADFMKKYGKAKAAIRADMKRIDEKLATSDTLPRSAAGAGVSRKKDINFRDGLVGDDPEFFEPDVRIGKPVERYDREDEFMAAFQGAGQQNADNSRQLEPGEFRTNDGRIFRFVTDPAAVPAKKEPQWIPSSEADSIASWKANNPGKSAADSAAASGLPKMRYDRASNSLVPVDAPPALDLSPKTKDKFDRQTTSVKPADGSGANPNIDAATRDRARAWAAQQNAPGAALAGAMRSSGTPVDTAKNKTDWKSIYDLNKAVIGSNPNIIKPGMKLKMPNGSTYSVQPGDTLSKIAGNQINELSTDKLAQYKTAAAKDARQADQEGDFKRGDRRFHGIVQATKKQFDNDAKKVDESRAARRALMARIVNSR